MNLCGREFNRLDNLVEFFIKNLDFFIIFGLGVMFFWIGFKNISMYKWC